MSQSGCLQGTGKGWQIKTINVGDSDESSDWVEPLKGANPQIRKSEQPKQSARATRKWSEGIVDTETNHIKIRYGDDTTPVALIAPGRGDNFIVQWLVRPNPSDKQANAVLEEVRRELDFYLVEKGKEDPWAYAKYHCSTAANLYSKVHWGWYPEVREKAILIAQLACQKFAPDWHVEVKEMPKRYARDYWALVKKNMIVAGEKVISRKAVIYINFRDIHDENKLLEAICHEVAHICDDFELKNTIKEYVKRELG